MMMAAVMPEPQLVTTGFVRSMPASAKVRRSASRSLNLPLSENTPEGRLLAPGIWPDRMPARGSGSSPAKRPALRASAIWESRCSTTSLMRSNEVTAFGLKTALKACGLGFATSVVVGRPSAFQPSIRHRERRRSRRP